MCMRHHVIALQTDGIAAGCANISIVTNVLYQLGGRKVTQQAPYQC